MSESQRTCPDCGNVTDYVCRCNLMPPIQRIQRILDGLVDANDPHDRANLAKKAKAVLNDLEG